MTSNVARKFLTDRVALVTASTKGIGFAIAKQLGRRRSFRRSLQSKAEKNVEEAVAALRLENIDAAGISAHVGIKEDRKKLIDFTLERYNKLDILVSNAAANPHYGDMLSISDKQWDKMLNVNVKSAFELTKEAVPHLEATGRGCIVFVSSVAGYAPMDGIGAYSVMKTALTGMSRSLSIDLARRNIRVNSIAPGIIRTDFSKALYADDAEREKFLSQIAQRRFGDPEECADAVAFLVSDEAGYITGETIGVNGGMQARI
ncbi:unnamed protein product [Caenorhabditis auriculariae]|uniref:Uncharacterized protein n=1 Tax=Caenorhabditis auriculariae TaxID=2777116 RepID=A0A8S1HWR4_9PELO|nr:unnamed protein product [Caenorhabditis auriculariae]